MAVRRFPSYEPQDSAQSLEVLPASSGDFSLAENSSRALPEFRSVMGAASEALGTPIRVGWASPLRVATGGDANWVRKSVAAARPPTRINGVISPFCYGKWIAQQIRPIWANEKPPENA